MPFNQEQNWFRTVNNYEFWNTFFYFETLLDLESVGTFYFDLGQDLWHEYR